MANKLETKVLQLSNQQIDQLENYCRDRGWELGEAPYTRWEAKGDGVAIAAYTSGKVTIQGKKAREFCEFVVEPEITHSFECAEFEEVTPHGGVDESGKGDFFGPLVIAAAYADSSVAGQLAALGVKDSKLIKSTAQIYKIAPQIRRILDRKYAVVTVGVEAYNRMYAQIGNLNRMLAWGHARAIENLLQLTPDCPRMLSDKFGSEMLIKRALMEKGRKVILQQQVRAEADIAVAAASILAREGFLRSMDRLSAEAGCELPRGASAKVVETAREIVAKSGFKLLDRLVKKHFKTYSELQQGRSA